jgi:hypothetical protein
MVRRNPTFETVINAAREAQTKISSIIVNEIMKSEKSLVNGKRRLPSVYLKTYFFSIHDVAAPFALSLVPGEKSRSI